MAKKKGNSKLFAFLAVFLGILGFIIVWLARRKDKYAMFYAKQSLVIFLVGVVLNLANLIPFAGWVVGLAGGILLLVLWIMALVNSLSGQTKYTPIIGRLGDKFNF